MKRSWSSSEGKAERALAMATASPSQKSKAAINASLSVHSQASRSMASSDTCPSPEHGGRVSAAESIRVSPSDSASSRERRSWPQKNTPKDIKVVKVKQEAELDQAVVQRVANMGRVELQDVAREGLDEMAERMQAQPEEYLEELKAELRDILSGTGGAAQIEQFALLQNLVQSRRDLFPETLVRANRIQLEILVAIKTGIQAFLHPDIRVTQSLLIEVFFHSRCRNMACQSQLPVDDCRCEICIAMSGFCNACMCVLCSKFDFDVNTCRWVGCDFCSHWTHTDCAIREGQIRMGPNQKKKHCVSEMIFKCKACGRTSELFGWVKDVFRACALDWDRDGLMKELDCVRRIFHGSEDEPGKRLYWKSEELLEKLKHGINLEFAFKEMQHFFQDMETKTSDDLEDEHGKVIEPQEACIRISEVANEADNMEIVATDKVLELKRARLVLGMCDRELDEKRKDLGELHFERQRKRHELDELEAIIRLKQAEAEMFQLRADEAQREADKLKRIALTKYEKAEEEYASKYLKLRLNEAEAERRYLFEKIKLQEYSRKHPDSSHMVAMCKIQYLVNRASNFTKGEGPNHNTPPSSTSQGAVEDKKMKK
ncbi:hypothetical protein O6H91_07G012800 [Diphasiastrum complanatum]|uniref:Uncharacterized protein n=1 Tax=Diphasiastrum complanatum TaxID=34168 RepID=A0ACC2D2J5_DIPCM|nr:hypothetical protein O6H91_07G012800 [Diphasiastrum complanatum]